MLITIAKWTQMDHEKHETIAKSLRYSHDRRTVQGHRKRYEISWRSFHCRNHCIRRVCWSPPAASMSDDSGVVPNCSSSFLPTVRSSLGSEERPLAIYADQEAFIWRQPFSNTALEMICDRKRWRSDILCSNSHYKEHKYWFPVYHL